MAAENPFDDFSSEPAFKVPSREEAQAKGRELHTHDDDCGVWGCDKIEGKPNNQNWDPKDIDPHGPVDRARHAGRRVASLASEVFSKVTGGGDHQAPASNFDHDEWDRMAAEQDADRRRLEAKRSTPEYKAQEAKQKTHQEVTERTGVPSDWMMHQSRTAPEGRSQEDHERLLKKAYTRHQQGKISVGMRDVSSYELGGELHHLRNSTVDIHPHGVDTKATHRLENVSVQGDNLVGSYGFGGVKIPLSEIGRIENAGPRRGGNSHNDTVTVENGKSYTGKEPHY